MMAERKLSMIDFYLRPGEDFRADEKERIEAKLAEVAEYTRPDFWSWDLVVLMDSEQEAKVTTKDYMVAIKPVSGGQSLIGLKPRSWEKNILAAQNDKIADISSAAGNFTMMFIGGGILLSLVIALMIAMITAGTSKKTLDLFDRLSLGDFDTDVPKLPERDKHIYIRLKTSLMMALERLGEK